MNEKKKERNDGSHFRISWWGRKRGVGGFMKAFGFHISLDVATTTRERGDSSSHASSSTHSS